MIAPLKTSKEWFASIFGGRTDPAVPVGIGRQQVDKLDSTSLSKLDGYFVRLRYNDKVVKVPGCKPVGKHLEGDDSFCTLVSSHHCFDFDRCIMAVMIKS